MNSSLAEHHRLVGDLFLEAQRLPPTDRASLLDTAARTRPDVVAEVRAMLEADSGAFGLLDGRTRAAEPASAPLDLTGATIGRYRIVRLLGAGGMGAVYEATQERPQRTVALKIMRAGLTSEAARHRFEAETEALARLRHPAVAQLYEAGVETLQNHRVPYFAMEFVDGARPITAYVADRPRNPRSIVRLLLDVCEGVHHGHQRGVIHRDLKPDNLLVDERGQAKVIDFGVARALNRDNEAIFRTQTGQLIGTVSYMSPEQVGGSGESGDVRSDVYSLGVVLFELLTGTLPYGRAEALGDLVSAIREGRQTSARALQPKIGRDLDLILRKALAPDPARRYVSVAEFAGDLRRWLNAEPILARPSGALYQLGLFARRHTAIVVGGAAVVLVLAGGVIAERIRRAEAVAAAAEAVRARDEAVWARQEADAARAAAQVEAARARRVTQFLDEMFRSVTPDSAQGRQVTVREVVDSVAGRVHEELADAPAVEATVRLILGQVYADLGAPAEAESMLAPALAIHDAASRKDIETARILLHLAGVRLEENNLREALRLYDRALEIAERPEDGERDLALIIRNNRGQVLYLMHDYAGAAANLREIIRVRLERNGPDDPDLAMVRSNLGMVLHQMGELAEAHELIAGAYEWRRSRGNELSSEGLKILSALAGVEFSRGNLADAERHSLRCIELHRAHYGDDHPAVAQALYMHGAQMANAYRYAEAEAALREALAIRERTYGPDHVAVADALGRLGPVLAQQGRAAEAVSMMERAVAIQRAQEPMSKSRLAWALHGFADVLLELRRIDEAHAAEREAVELLQSAYGPESQQALVARSMAAFIDAAGGRYAEACAANAEIVGIRERVLGADHQETTIARYNAADALIGLNDLPGAAAHLERALPRLVADYGDDSDFVRRAYQALSLCRLLQGDAPATYEAAREAWRRRTATPTAQTDYGYAAALLVAATQAVAGARAAEYGRLPANAPLPGDGHAPANAYAVDALDGMNVLAGSDGQGRTQRDELEAALAAMESSVDSARNRAAQGFWRPAFTLLIAAEARQRAGDAVSARELLEIAHNTLQNQFGPTHPLTRRAATAADSER
jgi:tetratricopeptide (TPR) repeat protein